ncbi:hypothetical protein ACLI1A_04880 [Flavobacterium sp. RHBU_3]|uniref:hypothetical protein n=1 Tax=Flavobacterium sp. RHBU_3 TaxID=3391184 RepID=UPI003985443A
MKKITEALMRKDASVRKLQFDREWFYAIDDVADYLGEDLSGVETVTLPVIVDGESYNEKCATWEDIERYRNREPLKDYKGSIFRTPTVEVKKVVNNRKNK